MAKFPDHSLVDLGTSVDGMCTIFLLDQEWHRYRSIVNHSGAHHTEALGISLRMAKALPLKLVHSHMWWFLMVSCHTLSP